MFNNILKFRRIADICTCILLILLLLILPIYIFYTVKLHAKIIRQTYDIKLRIT